MSNYFDVDAISQSGLKMLEENPRKFYKIYVAKRMSMPKTPALAEGAAFDLFLTEPERFKTDYADWYNDYRKKDKLEQFNFMREELYNKFLNSELNLKNLLKDGSYQEEIYWQELNIDCKAKLDWISEDKKLIIDFKTTSDSSEIGFSKSMKTYSYDLQAGMYAHAVKHKYNLNELPEFMFVAVQKTIPYTVEIFQCSLGLLERNIKRMYELLELYKYYVNTNEWAYSTQGILMIDRL